MKNLINYYYGLLIKSFKKKNDKFIFEVDNKNYEFVPFIGDINKFYNIYSVLIKTKNYCHEIVFNNNNSILTNYNGKNYILLKKNININRELNIKEILAYDVPVYVSEKIGWKILWEQKIDYYEYQMAQLSKKYNIIKNSFDYYLGLSENAINLLNYIDINEVKTFISHKRIKENEKLDDFFNPLNIIIDSRNRDIAEYIKINFFNNNVINIKELLEYLDKLNFNFSEMLLFFARLLYPSYYFDVYDDIIQEKVNEESIKKYIEKNISYEIFLKDIYKYVKLKYRIPEIEWLEN